MADGEFEGENAMTSTGLRLRAAREAAGMSLEEVATATRIPTRHLESLENADFERLPAPTYTIGFAKNYAAAVGLDRREIADQLRAEMGGTRPATHAHQMQFEPADPARSFPKWVLLVVLAAIVAVVLGARWWQSREYAEDGALFADNAPPEQVAPANPQPSAAPPAPSGPVVLTANAEVWLQVKDGATTLKEGILQAGQSYEVPATAAAPVLTTGKPEALRIAVGTADAPPVGAPATTVSNISLLAKDLMAARAATPAGTAPPPLAR